MTRITVIKPFDWTNAMDERGVVHRVVSAAGTMHLCAARCGLIGKWDHEEDERRMATLAWTRKLPSCMTCIVREARCNGVKLV